MKILYCNKYNFPFSGTETYLFEVMELVRSHGHQVALFSMADPRGRPRAYDRHFVPYVDFKQPKLSLHRRARLAAHAIYSMEARRCLRGLLAEFRPDLAHVRNIYHHLSPSILWELKAHRIPVLYHLNDFKLLCPTYNMVAHGQTCERCAGGSFWHVLSERCCPAPLAGRLTLAAEAYVHHWFRTYQKCVDGFLAPSRFVREKLVENGWDERKIGVLPHFQDMRAAPISAPRPDAPILYFGRLSPEKGVQDLLRAMQGLPNIRLQLAGDGPQRLELELLAMSLSLNNVEFLGHLQAADLSRVIGNSRFTVLPSRAYETFGKSILESYAHARAVIASDLGSRRELVREGQTGLLFSPGNVEALRHAIAFLVDHPSRAIAMGRAGRESVREHYSPEFHYRELMQIYDRLAHRNGVSSATAVSLAVPKPRIAFIGGRGVVSKYSGIESYYEEAGRRLAGMGYDITVYCRSHFTPPLRRYKGMRVVRLPSIRSKHLETLSHTLFATLHALFSRCDVVHYHALGPALFAGIPRLFGKKSLVTVQGLDWRRQKWGKLAASVLRLGEAAAVRLPNATVVVSRTLQDHFRAGRGYETLYVPNGTTIPSLPPDWRDLRWAVKPGEYILYLGRFSPEKNCHLLVGAYERIQTPVKLVLAGGSSYSDSYAQALRRHASDKIRLLDWVSGVELEQLLLHASLFVLPSDIEGLSLALLDAMAAGVCVLTSDIPENRELVDGAGFTVERGSVDDLERMLRWLLSDENVRQAAGLRGQQRIREHYLWPHIALQLDCVYRSLIQNPSPAVSETNSLLPREPQRDERVG